MESISIPAQLRRVLMKSVLIVYDEEGFRGLERRRKKKKLEEERYKKGKKKRRTRENEKEATAVVSCEMAIPLDRNHP